jgi:hypothetical protein
VQSKTMIFRRSSCLPNSVYRATGVAFIALASLALLTSPASALLTGPQNAIQQQLKQDSPITEVYVRRGGGAVHRSTVVGPRGGVYHGRTAVRGGAVVRGGGVRWARPGWYRWPAGGAIAAGAALGVVTAATAAAWAGAAPGPSLCWYYTDPGRTQGFWDACP